MSYSEKKHWRSLQDLGSDEASPAEAREFPRDDADVLEMTEVDRRGFMGIMSAGAALAGVALTPGCIRKPVEYVMPYSHRPEDLIPGKPRYFRTAFHVGASVIGLHVESQDGRPTKIEGNPDHPMSLGRASGWAQASVLDLYDVHRSKLPHQGAEGSTWPVLWQNLAAKLAAFEGSGGGLAVLVDGKPSPTRARLLEELRKKLPQVQLYRHDVTFDRNAAEAMALLGAPNTTVSYDLAKADVIVALDADVLGYEGDSVRNAAGFAAGRRVPTPDSPMNRLYAVEPVFSLTGMMADNRLRLPASQVGELLRGLAGKLAPADAPGSLRAQVVDRENTEPGGLAWSGRFKQFVEAVAADLAEARGKSAVIVGQRQPAWVHALAAWLNEVLGNTGKTVHYARQVAPTYGTIEQLAAAISGGRVNTLVTVHANPVYDAPADLQFPKLYEAVEYTIHLGTYLDETGLASTWHVPASHYLEAWGDLQAADGTVSVQQPLIAPMYDTVSDVQLLSFMLDGELPKSGLAAVRETLLGPTATEATWRRALHDGVAGKTTGDAPQLDWDAAAAAAAKGQGPSRPSPGALEVNFIIDPSVADGRFANNGWLQELPDPLSKLTWDNAALLSAGTAAEFGITDGDLVTVSVGGGTVTIAAAVVPGVADNVVVLPVGYGREIGDVAKGAGFDVYPLRASTAMWFAQGGQIKGVGEKYLLASTQDHGTMIEPITRRKRPVVRETTLSDYRKDPDWVEQYELMAREKLVTLWDPPNNTEGQQWGMAIDLNTCTGCNACTIACQAENNIPIVGKARVLDGREMHWIRVDRYFTGDADTPEAVVQPIPCMQCATAPCESVCPVAATAHSPEGLNDMAYNRCIGTRYCSNNCPFKVRRFNFFNYNEENEEGQPTHGLQKNPDVTVRFRGVMEKCTYCVQRIQEAKIAAKRTGNGVVPDGAIVPACAQTCPSDAIVFGDINDPTTDVSKLKAQPRNYQMLRELNLHTRTTYLAKLRNPNPALVKHVSAG